MKFLAGVAEFWREVRAHADDAKIDLRMCREIFQNPVEMTRIGSGGGDDGYLSSPHVSLQQYFGQSEIDIPGSRV